MLAVLVTALGLSGLAAPAAAHADPTAAPAPPTVVVHADQPFRDVTHVATGSLYGLATSTVPEQDVVDAIKPNTFVQMPIGGSQQPTGDIGQVWRTAAKADAKVVDRLSDYYPGFPYDFSWDTWFPAVKKQIEQVRVAGITNLTSYALWNEPDNTWKTANGTFEDFWTRTYNYVRSLDPTTPIQGPSFSDNISDMQNFLENAVATNTVPDILAWHELETSSKIAGDVAKVESIEDSLGIARRPIAIEEYAAPSQVGIPGDLVGYVAKFERLGINDAELAFWNQSGALGDLLTGQGGKPNGAYWLYKWYADMSGKMVATTPPGNDDFDAAAAVTSNSKEVDVITGGNSGPTDVRVGGLNDLALGSAVNVELQYTPSYGRTTAVSGPVTISNTTYQVGDDGTIDVPVNMNPAYGYHVVVTPAASPQPKSLAGTYTISNVNSGLALDTRGSSTATGTAAVQETPNRNSATQAWTLVDAGRGLYKIVNAASGLALGIENSSTTQGAPAVVWGDAGASDQSWQVVPDGRGAYRLENFGTGLVLAVDGMSTVPAAAVVQWTDGAITNGCTPDGPRQPGRIGTALSFCQTNSYVKLPTGVVSSLTGDYTVSAWVNPQSNAQWSRVFDIGSGPNASMFLTLNAGSGLRFSITDSGAGGEQQINATSTLPLKTWSLVTVTYSHGTGTLYVDGKVVASNTAMSDEPSSFGQSTANYLGKSQYGGDPALDGAIDDVNIYDRALSPDEVATAATGQVGNGDVVHYAFDETGGATVVDSSGNGADATIVPGSNNATTMATDTATADHFWTLTPDYVPGATLTSTSAANNGWYTGKVLVSLTSRVDGDVVQYRVDGGAWRTYRRAFTIAANGRHHVDDRLLASNVVVKHSTGTFAVDIDEIAPAVSVVRHPAASGSPRNPVTLTFSASDALSGVQTINYDVNGGAWQTATAGQPITFDQVGDDVVGYRAVDVAGNVSRTRSTTVRITADPVTSIRLSSNKVAAGGYETATLKGYHRYSLVTVALGPGSSGSATRGSTSLGKTRTDVRGSARLTVHVPAKTAPGTYTVTAVDASGLSSSASLKVRG